jgi:hypothetical protein
MPTAAINVKEVPTPIRVAVTEDARERDISVADCIGETIADYYGVRWESSGYPFAGTGTGSDQWVVRLPSTLKALVHEHARRSGNTMRGIVLLILARHYGLEPQSPRKRGGRQLDDDTLRTLRERHAAGESIRSLSREYRVKRETLTKALRAAA